MLLQSCAFAVLIRERSFRISWWSYHAGEPGSAKLSDSVAAFRQQAGTFLTTFLAAHDQPADEGALHCMRQTRVALLGSLLNSSWAAQQCVARSITASCVVRSASWDCPMCIRLAVSIPV